MPHDKYRVGTIVLFLLAFGFAALGIWCRSYNALSLFWPCNAIMAGLMIRFPCFNQRLSFPVIFSAMVIADLMSGSSLMISLGMTAANVVFMVIAKNVLLSNSFNHAFSQHLQTLLRVFPASILAAAGCAAVGSLASQHYFHEDFVKGWISWFCEQVSTSLLILPLFITLPRRAELPQLGSEMRQSSLLPLVALVVSTLTGIGVGGGGSLIFPLPALVWCAISYPVFFTCLLTLATGITEIVLVASDMLNIQGTDDFFRIDSLASARLGVAAMIVSPLIVALSTSANKRLLARITQRADYDYLTGALTRSGLAARLDALTQGKGRQHVFFGAVLVIDIDRFKSINDTWGHAAGDIVLAKTAERLQQSLLQKAMISRMGGEEFLILIEGISQPRALLLAERLRQSVERNTIMFNEHDLSVTISIGVSRLNLTHPASLDESIKTADEQLYIAKSSGRNRVSPQFVL
ncbi:GGDEF domain-containing protein [Erwinia oleae]|uniref:GGDEF domain-containing protein n=1 Tax=Erwinia oleae TaxID=796334 RepID=UPI0005563F1E|nr:GGDEF domain-containing protein [Erwinia oleae]